MRELIAGSDLANTVRMTRTLRQVAFLLVEGTSDLRVLREFVLEDSCDVLVCHGREKVLDALTRLEATGHEGVLAIVDADFDRVENRLPASPNCVVTDYRDLEVVLFESRALNKLLAERASSPKVTTFETTAGKNLREALLERANVVGCIRWANDRQGWSFDFDKLELPRYIDQSSLQLDFERVVVTLFANSARDVPVDALRDEAQRLLGHSHDLRHICCGHDLIELLGVGLRRTLGSSTAYETKRAFLERELRLSFDRECFENTMLYTSIRSWEQQNPNWRVIVPRAV